MQAPNSHRLSTSTFTNVSCPFCSLLCDDLIIKNSGGQLHVERYGCTKAIAGFERSVIKTSPRIQGREASLKEAVDCTARMLRAAKQPLFSGLGTDVAGLRAVLPLAERTGGILDHMHGDAETPHVLALQEGGWMSTTLTEIRNRADLIIFAGTDVVSDFPRFFERIVWNSHGLFDLKPEQRDIIYIGRHLNTAPGRSPKGRKPLHIECDQRRLPEIVSVLRTLLRGDAIQVRSVAGVSISVLQTLIERMQKARYGVLVWVPAALDFPHTDLAIQVFYELVKDLNKTTRFSGFSLGGNDGGITATNVCTWQSGYPLRTGFSRGYPKYDAWRYSTKSLLEHGTIDTLVWISSLSTQPPPVGSETPTIVLGVPQFKFSEEPDVFIPVGTPGVDHNGQLFRCDNVVALPMRTLRQSPLPSVASVMTAIHELL